MEPDCILETEGIFSMVQRKNVHIVNKVEYCSIRLCLGD